MNFVNRLVRYIDAKYSFSSFALQPSSRITKIISHGTYGILHPHLIASMLIDTLGLSLICNDNFLSLERFSS